jgi:hypothetical protein
MGKKYNVGTCKSSFLEYAQFVVAIVVLLTGHSPRMNLNKFQGYNSNRR